jgi:archaellin
MPAAGKTNASRVQINDRIIVRVAADGTVWESTTKTGEGVQVARVTGKHAVQGGRTATGRGTSRMHYLIETSAGPINAAPVQTFWLAPEDNAGIKRAHAEALAEDETRQMDVRDAERTADEDRWSLGSIQDMHVQALEDARQADHAEALTLHSQDGKVDNMNNDDDMPGRNEAHQRLAEATDKMLADLGHRVEIDEAHRLPVQNHTGSTVVTILEKVWARIREDHPELPEVVIITGSGEGSKWGHFRADSWKIQEEGATIKRHELFLASEALAKGPFQVLQTMVHEAAHTLSRVRGVQDTSRQGRWHNAQFRSAAEEMGLAHKGTTADKTHGFAFVTLTESTKARYADLIEELGREIRLTGHLPVWLGGDAEEDDNGGERMTGKPKGEDDKKPHSGSLKATCECPEPIIIRLSRKVLDMGVVRCDDCERLFTHKD